MGQRADRNDSPRECAQALTCLDDVTFDVLPQYQTHTHAGEALYTLFSFRKPRRQNCASTARKANEEPK